jgi:hypothetical protein
MSKTRLTPSSFRALGTRCEGAWRVLDALRSILQALPTPIVPWCSNEFSELWRSTRVLQASAEATQKGKINSRIDGDCFCAHGLGFCARGLGHSVVALVALGPVPPDAGLSSVWVICTVQYAALLLRGSWHVAPL